MNQLEKLKQMTTVVADTGDFASIKEFLPQDSTTNPSLIYKACQKEQYFPLIQEAIDYAKKMSSSHEKQIEHALERVMVNFGKEILKIIPGKVSVEVDARYSFNTKMSIEKALRIVDLFAKEGINKDRLLIKLATTWEGLQAAKALTKQKIDCNMTLIFSLHQAVAAAEIPSYVVSPFVGRILDWYKKKENRDSFPPHEDPGVLSTTKIYNYLKKHGYPTKVLGASFRNKEEIIELAGCDLLTISPALLEELKQSDEPVKKKLSVENAQEMSIDTIQTDEKSFRNAINNDPMASEKLKEGIDTFSQDIIKLEEFIRSHF